MHRVVIACIVLFAWVGLFALFCGCVFYCVVISGRLVLLEADLIADCGGFVDVLFVSFICLVVYLSRWFMFLVWIGFVVM